MWQDYIGIVPGMAAAIMGVVTLMTAAMPLWQKYLIVALTVVAIGATGVAQWWTLHEKTIQDGRRTQTLEQLGVFIGEGETLMAFIASHPTDPIPNDQAKAWEGTTIGFLQTLGNSYVTRFVSTAGLTPLTLNGTDAEHNNWWLGIRMRVTRLNEFSSEFSGQIPKSSQSPF